MRVSVRLEGKNGIGPTDELRKELTEAGIEIVIHKKKE